MMRRRTDGSVGVVILLDPGAPDRLVAECIRRVSASRRVRVRVRVAGRQTGGSAASVPDAEPGAGSPLTPPSGGFLLELPWFAGLDRSSLGRLMDLAGHGSADLINVLLPGARDASTPIRLWRVDLVGEARRRQPDEAGQIASGEPARGHWVAGSSFGVVDLRRPPVSPVSSLFVRVGWLARTRLPAAAYAWLAPRAKNTRQRVRNYLFLD